MGSTSIYILGVVAAIAVITDLTRVYSPTVHKWTRWTFGPLVQAEELPEVGERIIFNGANEVLVGATLLVSIFPLRVCMPVSTMTILADAAAPVGSRLENHHWGTCASTVEGSFAFVVTGLAVVVWFPHTGFGLGAVSAVVAAVVEALPLPVNDNIRVPLTAAAVLFAGRHSRLVILFAYS